MQRTSTASERLETLISDLTARSIRNLRVEIVPGTILIFGQTDRFYAKQMAQELVRGEMRETRIDNRITVETATRTRRTHVAVLAS
jgi:hypothetical protein